MRDILGRVQNVRVPIFLVVVFWLYAGYKFLWAGYIGEAYTKAKEYMREVKL